MWVLASTLSSYPEYTCLYLPLRLPFYQCSKFKDKLDLFEENVQFGGHCIIYKNKLIHKRCILGKLLEEPHIQSEQDENGST